MRRVLIGFGFFLLAVAILTAILSPPAFWLCDHFFPNTFPFRRVFNRMLMISALAMLYPLARYWKIDSWQKLGIQDSRCWKRWFIGMLIGMATISALFWILAWSGYSYTLNLTLTKFLKILTSAILVGLLEEILFRGMFFYALKDWLGKWLPLWAIVISGFFAKTHFIKAEDLDSSVNWLIGWTMWLYIWPSWSDLPNIVFPCFNLFLVGLLLCALVWRMKSLWFAMGLHTGWVVVMLAISHNKNPLEAWQVIPFLLILLAVVLSNKKHEHLDAESC